MDKLKNCPFCGSPAELTGECDMVWARCKNYDCKAERLNKFDEPEDAIEDWNRRVTDKSKSGTWKGWTTHAFIGVDDFGDPKYAPRRFYRCTICRNGTVVRSNYCANCGAKMGGET
jgi:hypothetical protein